MKQTAVEWLVEQIEEKNNGVSNGMTYPSIFEQAKEMEKQQIINAFNQGERYGWESKDGIGNLEEMKSKIPLISLEELLEQFKNK
jgi:hypothetical protein